MPEFTVKEVRLPELRMPELKRDEIVRSLSGVRLPDVDLAKARDVRIKVPIVTLTGSDVGKILAAMAAIARFVRPATARRGSLNVALGRRGRLPSVRIVQPRRRPRRRLAIGALIVAVIGGWAILRRRDVRQRLDGAARQARDRFQSMRAGETTERAATESFAESPATGSEQPDVSSPESPEIAASSTSTPPSASPAFEESSTIG